MNASLTSFTVHNDNGLSSKNFGKLTTDIKIRLWKKEYIDGIIFITPGRQHVTIRIKDKDGMDSFSDLFGYNTAHNLDEFPPIYKAKLIEIFNRNSIRLNNFKPIFCRLLFNILSNSSQTTRSVPIFNKILPNSIKQVDTCEQAAIPIWTKLELADGNSIIFLSFAVSKLDSPIYNVHECCIIHSSQNKSILFSLTATMILRNYKRQRYINQ